MTTGRPVTTAEATSYRNSRPAKRMGAGVLLRDSDGKVLLVEPTYKETWELPGGATEADESPAQCAGREAREELGIDITVGRLLVVEWQAPERDRTESLMWIYDGGVLHADAISRITLPPDELASYQFCGLEQIRLLMSLRLSRRVEAALQALREGALVELESGVGR